jgi:nitroimidazol reductase NimA-like FMN-containing flavoprotein (pyridoxamine 5'-phosphate oxidase superfamily)
VFSAIEMSEQPDLQAVARSIIDSNRYMTLATADGDGVPWGSPVWYAPVEYREFLWVSSLETRHSRNLAVRPQLAIVIFDSHEAGGWKAVYMSAVAEQLADVDEAIEIFSRRGEAQGLRRWTREDVLPPARHRLFRATATEQFVLDPHDQRRPVDLT